MRATTLFAIVFILLVGSCTRQPTLAPEGALVVLMDASPGSLDDRFGFSDYGVKISRLIFSRLVTTDTPTGSAQLDLATEIRNPSETIYEVDIRTDAVFHDGHPLTVDDVVYSFTSLDEVESPRARAYRDLQVTAVDEDTVRFVLPEARATFIQDLGLAVVPRHILEPLDGRWRDDQHLVGSGPYVFLGRQGEHEIVVTANADYYGGAPNIDAIAFRLIRDDNSRILAMLSGSGHMSQNAIPPLLLPVVERYEHLGLESAPSFKLTYMIFNMRHEILADRRVRQAIAYAIDRQEIIDQKFLGMGRLASGLLAPDHWAFEGDVTRYPYDPDRARDLLDEAGYPPGPDGVRFSLVFKVSANKFRRAVALVMAHQLGVVGIEVEVQAFEWGTFFYDVRSGNFELASLQWPNVNDPDHYHYIFHSSMIPTENGGSGANRGAYRNEIVDELLERGRRTIDIQRRSEIYGEVQRLVADDLPYVNLWHEDNFVVHHRGMQGYDMVPNARFSFLPQASWSQSSEN